MNSYQISARLCSPLVSKLCIISFNPNLCPYYYLPLDSDLIYSTYALISLHCQAHIALGFSLVAAADLRIGSCPMGGFIAEVNRCIQSVYIFFYCRVYSLYIYYTIPLGTFIFVTTCLCTLFACNCLTFRHPIVKC